MDYEAENGDRYDDEAPRYERDNRSASPRPARDDNIRRRSVSPDGNLEVGVKDASAPKDDDDGAINPGSNLFVTGIHPRLTEPEVAKMFEKYGEVEKCQIMRDPHTKDSRGFGFVKMITSEQAEAAREGLQGEVVEGRTLSIEKARRARPRTPTPGRYFGPKRDPRVRLDGERRRGGYASGGYARDDNYRYRGNDRGYERNHDRGYERRYDERGYDRSYRDERRYEDRSYGRDYERNYERRDRDENYGRERYNARGEDRERYSARGGSGGYDRDRYERPDREAGRTREPATGSGPAYGESASRTEAREPYGGPEAAIH